MDELPERASVAEPSRSTTNQRKPRIVSSSLNSPNPTKASILRAASAREAYPRATSSKKAMRQTSEHFHKALSDLEKLNVCKVAPVTLKVYYYPVATFKISSSPCRERSNCDHRW